MFYLSIFDLLCRMRVCLQTSELLRDLSMQNLARKYRLSLTREREDQVQLNFLLS